MIKTPKKVISVIVFCTFQLLLTCNLCYPQPVTQEWVRIYPDTNTFYADSYALALDDSGNVYVTGHAETSQWSSYCAIKYSSSGKQQWVANYFSNNSGGRYAYAIALDKFSNVYVTGYSYEYGRFFDYCTIKYNTNGVQQWIRFYDDSLNGRDQAEKIAVDNAGNIYVSGYSQNVTGDYTFTTVKYSTDGAELWVRRSQDIAGAGVTYVNGIAIDDSCNVYITGEIAKSMTIKYDSSGTQLWAQYYSSGIRRTGANSIVLDKYHNVYITGFSGGVYTESDFFTIKYSSSGIQQWIRRYSVDSTTFSKSVANSVAVDVAGNVYVSGYTKLNASALMKLTSLKYSSSGQNIWIQIDTAGLCSEKTYMDIDKSNNIYVLGCNPVLPRPYSYGIIKYDSSGNLIWRRYEENGSYPYCIRVDDKFNILLSGSAYIGGKMCTVKFSQIVGLIIHHDIGTHEFKLCQNYPNPFNPSTIISYQLPMSGLVKLIVYDILGREVTMLVNTTQKAGIYNIEWEASKLPSGIYFYTLFTEGFTDTRKMVLIK